MNKLFAYGLAIVVCLGTAGLLASSNITRPNQNVDAHLANDGAYRDGLFLGKLAAERRRPLHPLTGRWSTGQDRASFVAGYRRAYNDVLASAAPNGQIRPE